VQIPNPPQESNDLSWTRSRTKDFDTYRESQALKEIRREFVDEDIISTDPDDLHAHGYSEWSTSNPDGLPVAVAYPRSTEQVSAIARVCHKYRVPMIPYSGGSSLEGNFSAPYGGISVDFAYMDKIVQFNKADMDIVVQPSIGWQDLNEQLAKMGSGLFFPIDPGPSAKIGGMIGTNCSGTNAVKYGTMKDWVINLTVVLADGTVIKTRRRPRKSSAGYNLNGLFVGSEGTLGLVTEATLKLTVVPEDFSVAVVTFPSIRDAASAAAEVMQAGIPVAAMEIMDEVQMKVVNMGGATAPRVWKELPTLFFKFSGTKAGVKENISLVQRITKGHKGGNFEFAKDAREQKLLWSARKESLWSMLALRKDGEEVCKFSSFGNHRHSSVPLPTFFICIPFPLENKQPEGHTDNAKQGARTSPSPSAASLTSSRSQRRRWMSWGSSRRSWGILAMATSTRASSTTGATRRNAKRSRRASRIWCGGRSRWRGLVPASTRLDGARRRACY
jgi:FAD/FMN-containing dehydrogenase